LSKIIYTTTTTGSRWCLAESIFTTCHREYGDISVRQGLRFAASHASAVLGPDLAMSQQLPHPPTATGPIWNQLVFGGPPVIFADDMNHTWIRGHLINGRWGGTGAEWYNLTPLTATANANHKTVEGFIDEFIRKSLCYEEAEKREYWYGVYYCVQCSFHPFSDHATSGPTNLYSYAPAFIKISWRAVSIHKPVNKKVEDVRANLANLSVNPVRTFPRGFPLPDRPAIMANPVVPVGNVANGAVLGALPVNFPAAEPGNHFDGEIEIHQ